MDRINTRIQQALNRAEAEVRDAGAEAFRTGDDVAAGQARDVVAALKALRLRLNGQAPDALRPQLAAPPRKHARSRAGKKKRRDALKENGKSGYPRYEVRNGSLVRIGWSKKEKSEYQHKAPREIFERTVAAMEKIAQSGSGPFTAEQVIEQTSDTSGAIPGYQAYVVIGLLRDQGCVEQVGREGYMIPEDVSSRAMHVWNELAGSKK